MGLTRGAFTRKPGDVPRRPRRPRRPGWRVAILLVAAGILHLAVHAGPVRQAALAKAASWLDARMDWRLTANRLDYNLWTLSASAEGVAIAQRSAALPFFRAERVEVRMAAAVLTGRPVFREIRVSRPVVDMTRLESGSGEGQGFTGLGAFELGALRVDHLDLTWGNPNIVQAVLHDVNILADGSRPGYVGTRSIEGGRLTVIAPNTTIPFDNLSAGIELDGARVRIASLHATSPDAALDITGTVTLGTREPLDLAYRATISADPASNWFVDGPVMKGHVALDGHVVGPYTSPRATIAGDATGFGWTALKDAHMRVGGQIDINAITLDTVAIDAPIGRLRGRTRLAYDEQPLSSTVSATWSLRNMTTVSAFTETSPDGVPPWPASGTAELRWTNVLPTLADLAGRVGARFSTVGNPDGDMATATLSGGNRRWRVAHRLPLPGNTIATIDVRLGLVDLDDLMHTTISGEMTAATDDAPQALAYLAKRGAAVPSGAAEMAPAGTLAFAGPVSGTVDRPSWHTTVTGSNLRIADVRDLAVRGTLDIDTTRISADALVVEAPGSRIHLDGSLPLDGPAGSGSFSGLIDSAWLLSTRVPDAISRPSPSQEDSARLLAASGREPRVLPPDGERVEQKGFKVAGVVSVKGSWNGTVDRIAGHLDADAQALTLADRPLGPVHATVTTDGAQVRVEAQAAELGARLDGTVDISQPWRYTASLDLAKTDLARAATIAGVASAWQNELKAATNATVTASGTIEDLAQSDVAITIDALDGTLRGHPLALAGKATVTRQRGVIEVAAPGVSIGGATLVASGRLDPGSRDVPADPLSAVMTASLADLLALAPPNSIPEGLTAEGSVRIQAQLPGTTLDTLRAQVQGDVVSATRDGVALARTVHLEGGLENGTVVFSEIRGMLAGAETQVTADFPVGWVAPWLTPRDSASPVASPRGHLRGRIDAAIAPVLRALQTSAPELDGSAALQFDLSADAPQLDRVTGTIAATSLQVKARKAVFSQAGISRFRVQDGLVIIEALDIKGYGSNLTATGHLALTGARRHDVRLQGTLSMYLVDSLVAPRVDGSATVDLRMGGLLASPTLEGDVTLEDVNVTSATSRVVLADWRGNLTLRSNAIRIEALQGQVNGGLVSISGTLPLPGRDDTADALRVSGKDLFLEYPPGLRSLVTADLTVTRQAGTLHIGGTATVASEPYREPLNKMATLLAAFSGTSESAASGLPVSLNSTTLDVSVDTAAPLRLENSLGEVEMVPVLRLVGSLRSPALSGTVDFLDGGRVRLQSRVYDIRDSRLVFSPDNGLVPRLSVRGVTRVGEYTVSLRLTGSADAIETNLSSEPPLNERDLRSLLLTGQTTDQNVESTGANNFAVAAFSSDLLGVAGQTLGFDSVRIGNESFELVSSDVNPATRLTVSKRFAQRFELVFSDNLDDNTLTWIIVYRPSANLELRASSRDNLAEVVEFRQRVSFGAGGTRTSRPSSPPQRKPTARETVLSVTAIGDPGNDVAGLLSKLTLKAGSTFEFPRWIQDYEKLRELYQALGYYSARVVPRRMALDPPGTPASRVALEYRVTRGPVSDIVVSGYPADAALIDRLRRAWFTTAFEEFVPGDLERAMREYLIEQGFVAPSVSATLATPSAGRLRATVLVEAGPRPGRRVVAFSGAHAIPEAALVALVPPDSGASQTYIDPQPLCTAIVDLYASKGYLSASAQPEPAHVEGDVATLPIRITEGPQASVGTVSVAGVDSTRGDAVRAASALLSGAVFVAGEERVARLRVERFYRDIGYRDATVAARAAPPDDAGRVAVALQVVEGRQHVIRSVRVEGREATRQSLVDRAIVMPLGTPAGQQLVSATQRRLYDLGVFSAVDVRLEPASPPPAGVAAGIGAGVAAGIGADTVSVDAVVTIEEPQKYQLVYGVEFSNQYGPVFDDVLSAVGAAADVRDRNLFGRGLSLSVGGRYERNLSSLRSMFSIPTLRGREIQTNVFGTWTTEQQPGEGGSTAETGTLGGSIEQRWHPQRWLDLSWGYTFEDQRFDIVKAGVTDAAPQQLGATLASLNVATILDYRDSMLDAKRGWFHASSLQQGVRGLGSDLGYTRYLGRLYYFGRLGPVVSASAVRFGSLWKGRGTVPYSAPDLLFKAGGSQTVRGYSQDSLSPIVIDGIPIGGTRLLVANQEIRVSVTRWLGGVIFADAGNTFDDHGIVLRDLAVGLGFGVRIVTPLAPLRIDFGFPVPRRPGDPRYRWYISIGQMF